MAKYYAVKKGKNPGIYNTWSEAEEQIKGFSGASYKSFKTIEEATEFLNDQIIKEIDEQNIIDEETIEIYVDGSFSKEKKYYGSGWVAVVDDEPYEKKSFSGNDSRYVDSWQVAGEVLASLDAIQWAIEQNYKKVVIYHDYEGIEKWATGEWKAKKQVSQDYVNNYNPLTKEIDVRFSKVKAHSSNKFNDIADKLAKVSLIEKGSRSNPDGSLTIYGIDKDELELIFEIIESENEKLSVCVNQISENKCINYTLLLNGDKVVVNYYDTGISSIQGKESSLMEYVLIYILQLVEDSSEVIETLNVYNNVEVNEELVTTEFNKYLPNYNAKKIKSSKLELVLTTAAYNLTLNAVRPDYTDLIMPVLRSLEVYLHEMLNYAGLKTTIEKPNGSVTNNFGYFDCINNVYTLQKAHEKSFINESDKLEVLNSMYNFYYNNRHTLFHWNADYDDTRLIRTMEEARELIKTGFNFIDKFYIYY